MGPALIWCQSHRNSPRNLLGYSRDLQLHFSINRLVPLGNEYPTFLPKRPLPDSRGRIPRMGKVVGGIDRNKGRFISLHISLVPRLRTASGTTFNTPWLIDFTSASSSRSLPECFSRSV